MSCDVRCTHLLDAAGVLLHSDLLHGALKAKEGLDVEAGALFKASPLLVFWVNLQKHMNSSQISSITHGYKHDAHVTMETTHPAWGNGMAEWERCDGSKQRNSVCACVCALHKD